MFVPKNTYSTPFWWNLLLLSVLGAGAEFNYNQDKTKFIPTLHEAHNEIYNLSKKLPSVKGTGKTVRSLVYVNL
jgi:hypothetical protein